ncbi:MAG TPA: glycerophosphodiester phosphodiesterase [Candidatus Babeliales bacterium]|nr:glycerophosphodiester phosphodiesterase [Candidatus Babeliales bacterium]
MNKKCIYALAMITFSMPLYPVLKVGHRGACGYEPDNTLRSFAKAISFGVDMIELDVHVCKSGELVVFHDHKLNKIVRDGGYVAQKTLAELQALDVGKGEAIPTLSQVFDLMAPTNIIINIELKGMGTAQAVAELIQLYVREKGYSYERFVVTSFNHYELETFRTFCAEVSMGAIINGLPIGLAEFGERVGASCIVVDINCMNQALVDDAHARGMKIMVYTVNDYDDIALMKAMGVDGIISNFPDRI